MELLKREISRNLSLVTSVEEDSSKVFERKEDYIGTDKEDSRLVFILQCKSFQSRTQLRANSLTISDGFSYVEKDGCAHCRSVRASNIIEKKKE